MLSWFLGCSKKKKKIIVKKKGTEKEGKKKRVKEKNNGRPIIRNDDKFRSQPVARNAHGECCMK